MAEAGAESATACRCTVGEERCGDCLRFEGVGVVLGKRWILDDISGAIPAGRWTHIVGPNGAGKSTLLRTIAGVLPVASGRIFYRCDDLSRLSPNERARIVAYVPQRIEALPPIRAVDFVAQGLYAQRASGEPRLRQFERAFACLASMRLERLAFRSIDEVSGGERQMLVLCSAILQNAKIILFDEPTASLDIRYSSVFFEEIARLRSTGKTIVSVSHDLRQTASYADNVLVLKEGRCIEFAKNRFPSRAIFEKAFDGISPEDWEEIERRATQRARERVEEESEGRTTRDAYAERPSTEVATKGAREGERRREVRAIWVAYGILAVLIAALPWVGATSLSYPFDEVSEHIFFNLRVPRVLFAVLAGGVLAAVGASFQALFQNPLASPYTLGIASGASLGALIAIQWGVVSALILPSLSALGGLISLLAVLAISQRFGMRSSVYCLLAGVATSMFCSACGLVVQAFATPLTAQQMMRWQLGGLELAGYDAFSIVPVIVVSIVVLLRNAPALDLIAVDTELAQSRGVDVLRARRVVIVAASVAAALVVSQCGPISFVGLVVPNVIRTIYRCDMRTTYVLSIPAGAIALLVADVVSRMLEGVAWIPVGVVIALIGVPVFVALLFKRRTFLE